MNDLSPQLEADLLALIEGQPLSAAQRAAIDAALAADPALAALIRSGALESDRQQLRSLGDVRAPADLLHRVETILEREALIGISEAAAASPSDAPIPISRIQPSGPSVWSIVTRNPWSRPLAIAAGLALVAGVSLMIFSQRPGLTNTLDGRQVATSTQRDRETLKDTLAAAPTPSLRREVSSRAPEQSKPSPIVSEMSARTRTDLDKASPDAKVGEAQSEKTLAAAPSPLPIPAVSSPAEASHNGPGGGTASRALDMTNTAPGAAMQQSQSGSLSRAFHDTAGDRDGTDDANTAKLDEARKIAGAGAKEELDAKAQELSSPRAIELATAGRLAIRVTAPSTDDALRTVRSVHTKVARVTPAEDLPADQFARLVAVTSEGAANSLTDRAGATPTSPPSPPEPITAGAKPVDKALVQPAPQTAPLTGFAKAKKQALSPADVLSLRLPADATSLTALLRSLNSGGTAAQLVELRAPVGMGVQVTPIDVSEIVWWTQPPTAWTPRVQVPVIVEQKP